MIESNVERFFSTARERYAILQRKQQGGPAPYTEDPIFQQWRFCNTFREDDKTTVWFRQNVRGFLQHRKVDVIRATIGCRWFNRISTWERIQAVDPQQFVRWDSEKVREILTGVNPVVTGAYIIKTPNGKNKLEGILWCLEQILPDTGHLADRLEPETTCEGFWTVLQSYPYLGGFMAYQIVSDLLHTDVLKDAPDCMTWACPGPGCARGIGWLCADSPELFRHTSAKDRKTMLVHMKRLLEASKLPENWPAEWPKWEMQSIQHWACEYDKYTRAMNGQDQKRRYR